MLDLVQKRKIRSVVYHKATLAVLFVILLLVLHAVWGVFKKEKESKNLLDISIEKNTDLRNRFSDMGRQIEDLKSEKGLEAEIRAKFDVAKENEKVVVVMDEATDTSSTKQPKSTWRKFLDLFGF